jgi:hypothetical protein
LRYTERNSADSSVHDRVDNDDGADNDHDLAGDDDGADDDGDDNDGDDNLAHD